MRRASFSPSIDDLHQQGSLDALCGIYACINGIALLTNCAINSGDLFSNIVRRIGSRRLPGVVLNGLSAMEFEKLVLPPCIRYCAIRNVQVHYQKPAPSIELEAYWHLLKEHCAQHGAGSIILSVWGTYDHWTCVKTVTDRSMMLADSSMIKRINRSSIGFDERKRHRVIPNWTYLLHCNRKL